MCGILFTLRPSSSSSSFSSSFSSTVPHSETLTTRISQRGPDLTHTHHTQHASLTLTFTSSVLSLRGPTDTITPQPLIDPSTGSVLCWNGEAWRVNGSPLEPGVNDGAVIFQLLLAGGKDVPAVMEHVEGPWAMVYWDAVAGRLWYGRDALGRRSLLWKNDEEAGLVVASVGDGHGWSEVDADGLRWVLVGGGETGVVPWIWEEDGAVGNRYMKMPFPKLSTSAIDADADSPPTSAEIEEFGSILTESVNTRVRDIPLRREGYVRLAILFSGGLDCTVLARIVHECLPPGEPVDLLNVAFENPRVIDARKVSAQEPRKAKKKKPKKGQYKGQPRDGPELEHKVEVEAEASEEPLSEIKNPKVQTDTYELCPDRLTGRKSHAELLSVCPRPWRFHAINIPQPTLHAHRATVISLMHPHNTEMDLSIALAFYFASRSISDTPDTSPSYTTPSRILLSGLGADELLGGYTRHLTAHRRSGTAGLIAELQLDLSRLGQRNLGRDDRVLSHWGREARYPFLDERVVRWCVAARVGGKRDKALLRGLAVAMGMSGVAGEKKRAVQFGCRSAKMEKGRVKGTGVLGDC
ncbi:asparagine synthase-domain-containing protein [Morchella snyderi]|nr:asparagine synthase-domain-containing protein [Morchella snyderi]